MSLFNKALFVCIKIKFEYFEIATSFQRVEKAEGYPVNL